MGKRRSDAPELDLEAAEPGALEEAVQEALEAVEASHEEEGPSSGEATPDTPGEAEIERLRDRLARALADFDNYRKRVRREREEERRFQALEPMRDFLGVVDNLERALASFGSVDDLKIGVEMILKQMQALLDSYQVSRVETVSQPFDPRLHDAVSRHETEGVEHPVVTDELLPGYTMHGRLVRPARVRVAVPPEDAPAEPGHTDDGEDED